MCPFEIELMQLQSQSKFQVLRYDHDQLLPKKIVELMFRK